MKKSNIFLTILNIILSISLIIMILLYLNAINISRKNVDSILKAAEENFEANKKIAELEEELANYKNEIIDNNIDSNTETAEVNEDNDNSNDDEYTIEYLENPKIEEIQKGNTDYILLYNGFEIEKKPGAQYPDYMELTDKNKVKYNIDYYNYSNNEFSGVSRGEFGKEIAYENYSFVDNVEEIATSKKFNLIPREITKIEDIPEKIKSKDNEIKTTLAKIDLDGDNKFEYIAVNTKKFDVNLSEEFIQPGVMEYFSSVIVYNENFEKIDTLITINDDYADSYEYFIDIDKIKFLDIDNDGIVEILVEFPIWEGPAGVSIYKYNKGKLEGDIEYTASITP